jgi:hypothetical protein
MPHSYVSNLMHCIFSTKARRKQKAGRRGDPPPSGTGP